MEAADDAGDTPEPDVAQADTPDHLTWRPIYDAAGTLVPCVLWPAFEYSKRIVELAGKLRAQATIIEYVLQARSGPEYVDVAHITQLFDEIYKALVRNRPLQVCLSCYHGGKGFQTSCECKGLGWLPLMAVTESRAKKWRKESHKHYKKRLHARQRFLMKFRQLLEQENITASDIAWTPSAIRWLPRIEQLTGIAQGSSRRRRLPLPSHYHVPQQPEAPQIDQDSYQG